MLSRSNFKALLVSLFLMVILCGCQPVETPIPASPGAEVQYRAEEIYNNQTLLEIDIRMEPALFEQLSNENRISPHPLTHDELVERVLEIIANHETPENFYNWYPADVVINGQSFSLVAIRKKGLIGSYTYPVPGLKLKLDHYSAGQNYLGASSFTLNNAASDKTRIRTCLTYELFAAAGYPAPLCSLAKVSLNGEPLDIYVNVEPLKEPFLMRAFGNDTGSLYEGGESDFMQKDLPRFLPKTALTDESKQPLMDLMDALDSPGEVLIQELSDHLNIDQFIRYWALEMVTGHMDGYSSNKNNFFIYFNPDDGNRAVFIPWGADLTFFPQENNLIFSFFHYLIAKLPARLADDPEIKQQMIEEVRTILEEVWNQDAILDSIDKYEQLIMENRSHIRWNVSDLVVPLKAYVRSHPSLVLARLEPMFDLPRATPRRPGMAPHDPDQQVDYVIYFTGEKLVAIMDVNKDGRITIDEIPQDNRTQFSHFDLNLDGGIDPQEAEPIAEFMNMGSVEPSLIETIFAVLQDHRADFMVIFLSIGILVLIGIFRRKY